MRKTDEFLINSIKKSGISQELIQLIKLVIGAGEIAEKTRQGLLQVKYIAGHGFVTTGDLKVTEFLTEGIRRLFPHAFVLSEETKNELPNKEKLSQAEIVIFDPIDGTRWYKDGGDLWTITIGVVRGSKIEMAVTYRPATQHIYFVELGKGAYQLDNKKKLIRLDLRPKTDFHLVAIGAGTDFSKKKTRVDLIRYLSKILEREDRLTIIQSSALELAWLACGISVNGLIHPYANPWDKVAGMLLIKEAGGIATGWPGKDDIFDQGLIAAANKSIYDKLVKMTKE